ncbi:MAG: hypothetical protein UV59_C0002G0012 [Candidatus Gottesmanbacteria bacterium GW2011_GWA1_43_11]|uniref:Glycosyltransferase RgtA/B/C/D-like domain-containing protein n=1 Tax=Candidatus Gottesmanbacteria bacterium GW2011_GWA1_43_11 TaxID=1618436 RepID=A0A0G1CKZ7_9BACT|nr:MAG: hypothetical protein UV59_C0002G0012 [Candidatus Gottesmanbacteria bacterium GW2011_GWA1_43_11]
MIRARALSRTLLLLAGILLIASVLRFYRLGTVPVSLYWDEAAIAYNAYSILTTGKDEYGTPLPLLFRSFDDYKTPGIIYLTTIPIALFGLNEFSARFTSAFIGTFTVLAVYGLTYELTKLRNEENVRQLKSQKIGLLAALFFAISPWSVQFSRANFEANAGLFFVAFGFYYFLKGFKKGHLLIVSALLLGLSLYFYRSIQLVVPILLFASCVIFIQKLLHINWKVLLFYGVVLITLTIPIARAMTTPQGMVRYKQTTIFAISELDKKYVESSQKILAAGNNLLTRLIYNRRLVPVKALIGSYISNWDPAFLFVNAGGNSRSTIQGFGLLYLWQLPFFLLGLIFLLRTNGKLKYFLFLWLLVAPLPTALTTPPRNPLRSLNILPIMLVIITQGAWQFTALFSPFKQKILLLVIALLIGFSQLAYLRSYYSTWSRESASEWADGYKQALQYVRDHEAEYEQIVMSGHYWQPYIYAAFYNQYPPDLFQINGSRFSFGKFVFGGTSWAGEVEFDKKDLVAIAQNKKTLFILTFNEYIAHARQLVTVAEIKSADGTLMFLAGELSSQ